MHARANDTIAMAEAAPGFAKPDRIVDLDEIGGEYLRQAKINTAVARWNTACPELLKVTDWSDARIAKFAAQHAKILGWVFQRTGLIASGPSGAGKTRSMWALMKRLAADGLEIRYFTAAEFFAQLQANIRYGHDDAHGWICAVARAPIVFIDDLGQESVQAIRQEWCSGWFFQFLDKRLGNQLPLFITTNLSADEMAGATTALRANPLIRRLLELCEPVKFLTTAINHAQSVLCND